MGSMLVIASFVLIAFHTAARADVSPLFTVPAPASIVAFAAPLLAWFVAHVFVWWAGRMLDRSGRLRVVFHAERLLSLVRWFAVLWLWPSLDAGWGESAASAVFHAPGLAEVAVISPVLLVATLTWWSFYPIDRRLREAVLFRQLAEGAPIHRPPSAWRFVTNNIRHQLLIILVPITLIHVWGGAWDAFRVAHPSIPGAHSGWPYVVGVVIIITLMPWVLRVIWHTQRLGPGPLRDALLAVCRRNRVRVADLLVWHTDASTVNALVTGVVAPARFILFSDALLDALPRREIEAVTGHEVGHVRRRHLVWLSLITMGIATGAWGFAVGTESLLSSHFLTAASTPNASGVDSYTDQHDVHHPAFVSLETDSSSSSAAEWLFVLTIVGAATMGFGSASRTFELQADAFAVADLSRTLNASDADTSGQSPASHLIRDDAVDAMQSALRRVAALNGINPRRFTFRHGSINTRLLHLQSLRGRPLHRLPIDRRVTRVKWLAAIIIALVTLPWLAMWFLP